MFLEKTSHRHMQKKSDIIYLLMEKHITTYKILLKTEREPDGL